MTMQVGMVGSDGIILAGDTRRTISPEVKLGEPRFSGRYAENATKIKISDDQKIAVSSALCLDTAERIAAKIIKRLDMSKAGLVGIQIGAIAKKEFESAKKAAFHCIVVVWVAPKWRLYRVESVKVRRVWTVSCLEMQRIAVAGDNVNAAIFLAERYYNQWLHIEKKPVGELIPLAAQTIIFAHSLNTATVSGLEIAVCRNERIEMVSEETIEQLAKRASKREETIAGDGIRERVNP